MSTVPSSSLARQVPHTPPLQAYGASWRTRSTASRIGSPRRASGHDQSEARGHQLAMRHCGTQQAAVSVAHALEAGLKTMVDAGEKPVPALLHFAGFVLIAAGFPAQQVLDHRRDEGAREEV